MEKKELKEKKEKLLKWLKYTNEKYADINDFLTEMDITNDDLSAYCWTALNQTADNIFCHPQKYLEDQYRNLDIVKHFTRFAVFLDMSSTYLMEKYSSKDLFEKLENIDEKTEIELNDLLHILILTLIKAVLDNFGGLFSSFMSGNWRATISMVRPLYESYLIYMLISNHHNLAEPFFEYYITELGMFGQNSTGKLNISAEELKINMEELKRKYGDKFNDFSKNYGWTRTVVTPKGVSIQLPDIENHLGLSDNKETRKISNAFLHSTPYSLVHDEQNLFELCILMLNEAIEIMYRCFCKFMNDISCEEKDKLQIFNTLEKYKNMIKAVNMEASPNCT